MKTSILTLLAAAGFTAAAFAAPVADATPEGEAKIISYNIRLGVADDGANSWEHRREATLRMLEREAPTVFGIQEGYLFQVKYIEENLPQYGRWDGACNRTMTWVHLREKATGKEFYYFNTHLDHKGVVARREGVKLVVREVQQIAGRKAAVVVGGDLNSTIDDRIFDPLKKFMTPAREKAPVTDRKGTYNGWGQAPNSMVIDHLFVRNMKCLSYRTLDGDYGVPYISDHYPIEIVVRLK